MLCNSPLKSPCHINRKENTFGVKALFVAAAMLLLSAPDQQANASITPPAEVQQSLPNAVLSGNGDLVIFFMTIYNASLWVERNPWDFNQNFALTIRYNRDVSAQSFEDVSIDEMKRYFDLSSVENRYREELRKLLPAVTKGDRITAIFDPQSGLSFFYNGTKTGHISDLEFAKRYIQIWLHPNAHYQRLRTFLLTKR